MTIENLDEFYINLSQRFLDTWIIDELTEDEKLAIRNNLREVMNLVEQRFIKIDGERE